MLVIRVVLMVMAIRLCQVSQSSCPPNEMQIECAYCGPKRCEELGQPVPCSGGTALCRPECVCVDGSVRAENGTCIPKAECQMADNQNDRIVYPDEVEAVKEAAAKAVDNSAGDTNTVEETPAEATTETTVPVTVSTRNMIVVPSNCPPGQQMGADGVCRVVW